MSRTRERRLLRCTLVSDGHAWYAKGMMDSKPVAGVLADPDGHLLMLTSA
jgi:hypothetical protein